MQERIDLNEYRMSDALIAFMKKEELPLEDRTYVITYTRGDEITAMDVEKDWHNDEECPFYDTRYSVFGETIGLVNGKVTRWGSDYPKGFKLITKIGESA
jgi:hypothetical protein